MRQMHPVLGRRHPAPCTLQPVLGRRHRLNRRHRLDMWIVE